MVETVERFQQIVAAFGITTRVRREMGRDISGACGQLALAGANADGKQPVNDVEDFVSWRRRQPREAKLAVNAECIAFAIKEGAVAAKPEVLPDLSKSAMGAEEKSSRPEANQQRRGWAAPLATVLLGPAVAAATLRMTARAASRT